MVLPVAVEVAARVTEYPLDPIRRSSHLHRAVTLENDAPALGATLIVDRTGPHVHAGHGTPERVDQRRPQRVHRNPAEESARGLRDHPHAKKKVVDVALTSRARRTIWAERVVHGVGRWDLTSSPPSLRLRAAANRCGNQGSTAAANCCSVTFTWALIIKSYAMSSSTLRPNRDVI